VAPDAFGDHRTKTQRGLQNAQPPDDGHRTLALASGALGHAWMSTRRCRDTVPVSGECSSADSPHRTLCWRVRCIIRCTSRFFFNLELRSTFTQPSSNFKKTQINTNWNWYDLPLSNPQFSQIFSLRHSSFYENSQVKAPRSIVWP